MPTGTSQAWSTCSAISRITISKRSVSNVSTGPCFKLTAAIGRTYEQIELLFRQDTFLLSPAARVIEQQLVEVVCQVLDGRLVATSTRVHQQASCMLPRELASPSWNSVARRSVGATSRGRSSVNGYLIACGTARR